MARTARFRLVVRQDALVALGVAVFLWLGSAVIVEDDLWAQLPRVDAPLVPSPGGALLLLGASVPLVLRRVAPLAALAGCVTASLGLQAVQEPSPLPLGVMVAMCTVAVHRRILTGLLAGGTYLCLLAVGTATGLAPLSDDLFYDYLVSLIATVTLGYGVALGRMRVGLAERRSDELAREQEERTRAVLVQEQARIAREVHDIVAHDVSVIVAQAAAARRVLPGDDDAAETLRAIEAVGRDALDGLRRLVLLLRPDGGEQPREPQPTLDGLPQLVAQVRRAGLPVELVVHGDARRLPSTVETNAYRIVQEALTNGLKHAGGTRATVALDYGPDVLTVEVRDDGGGLVAAGAPADRGSGFGLVGMQQRAALLRGRLRAGECESGGFLVSAELPLGGA